MTRELDPVLDEAARAGESDVAAAELPAFGAIVERARELAPGKFDATDLATARGIPLVAVDADDATALQPFVAAALAAGQADLEAHLEHGVPPLRASSRRRVAIVATLLGIAALAVAATGIQSWRASRAEPTSTEAAAAMQADGKTQGGNVVEREKTHRVHDRGGVIKNVDASPTAPEVLEDERASEGDVQPASEDPPISPIRSSAKRAPVPLADQLRALDEEAQRLLTAGDLAGADKALARLIKRGGKHRLVQLAYGDRFTIAHRRRTGANQVRLWKSYLRKFPRGQFADDARAGLCRHAAEGDRTACWREYLRNFPSGAYRGRAKRAIGEAG